MDTLISIAYSVFLGWCLARLVIAGLDLYYKNQIKELDQQIAMLKERVISMEIEVVDNVYYAYNQDNNSFVCQGTTLKEIQDNFKVRYPDCDGIVVAAPTDVLTSFRQQMKEIKDENSSSIRSTP